MAHAQEIQLQIREHESGNDDSRRDVPAAAIRRPTRWWMATAADMLMLFCGATVATLLTRLYFDSGGNSKWMATLVQSGGAPLLVIPLLLTPPPSPEERRPAASKMAAVYAGIGAMLSFDYLMYSYGLQYLPASTYALVSATQLAFNAVTSRLVNAQRFTALVANSVVVLTFSAALLAVGSASDETSSKVPRGRYAAGFALTLAASAFNALILSLLELTFEKAIGARTARWVLRVQLDTNLAATAVSAAGLLASGEWRTVPGEMAAFRHGPARYALTLAGAAVGWQAGAVGMMRLIARVSSLFANMACTVALPLVPVFAAALFGDKMTGVKVVAICSWPYGGSSPTCTSTTSTTSGAPPRRGPSAAPAPPRAQRAARWMLRARCSRICNRLLLVHRESGAYN
ncbi:hypothetical protein ACP70R_020553 [Stipagrostis hirtigluma subsp. patula]